ncbi:BclA C-terminal domain-containing protein [Arsenicibacter rosenii]|uniref:BclA C-terminal domain-containing protein n=1 Tax=Arsenicibacter rosenii TaxID=1750698 RepID=A0A1S2VEN5_9BACT|nr:hypothetical protein [Arsenicibacter rosenii]OIN56656.1 hypothetical protein BLX24_23800 [Arsenicibacter rosenii]
MKTMYKTLLALVITGLFMALQAQAQVGIGTTTPDASAQLEIQSTSKGLLIPRVTSTASVTSPAKGLIVYQTGGTEGFYYNSGTPGSPDWKMLSTGGGSGSALSYGYAANTSGSIIAVVLGGTEIPLPNAQNFSSVITNGANTNFVISTTGTYRLAYSVNLTAALLVGARLLIDGTANVASTINPASSQSHFAAETVVTLAAGTTISLQLFGLLGAATLQTGNGASLTIQQLN